MRKALHDPWKSGVELTPMSESEWGFDIECTLYLSSTVRSIRFRKRLEVRFHCSDCGKNGRTVFVDAEMRESFCTTHYAKSHPFRAHVAGFTLIERESTGRSVVTATYHIQCERTALKNVHRRRPALTGPQWSRVLMTMTCICGVQSDRAVQTNVGRPHKNNCICGRPLYYEVYDAPILRTSAAPTVAGSDFSITLTDWTSKTRTPEWDEQTVKLTLVHGTWPRGIFPSTFQSRRRTAPRWFEPSSAFAERLISALRRADVHATLSQVEWTGENSLDARESAARELAELLNQQRTGSRFAPRVIIAHSHGGNVALRAVQIAADLGADCSNIAIVTISTPFISIRANRFIGYDSSVGELVLSAALVTELSTHFPINISTWWAHIMIWAVEVLVTFLVLVVAESTLFGLHPVEPETNWRLRKYIEFYRHSAVRGVPLLVIRGANDEAALTIASAATGERLTRFMANAATRTATVIGLKGFVSLGPILAMAIASTMAAAHRQSIVDSFLTTELLSSLWRIVLTVIVALYAIRIISGALSGLFRTIFGRELFNTSFLLEASAESAPDTSDCATVVTFPDPEAKEHLYYFADSDEEREAEKAELHAARRMRHGLYNHPQVAETIAEWITTLAVHGTPPAEYEK
ncbi:hypothetical protein [Nocardia sp. CA-120079]|uniref:hypothetical protein n=1 Tax=Nocardia sp. CA-120079 TaxID=3239974 RepID=UPI003D969626